VGNSKSPREVPGRKKISHGIQATGAEGRSTHICDVLAKSFHLKLAFPLVVTSLNSQSWEEIYKLLTLVSRCKLAPGPHWLAVYLLLRVKMSVE
jgi:hypothetical protein